MARPITDQLDIGPISIATIAIVRPITDQLDIGPINIAYNYCQALH